MIHRIRPLFVGALALGAVNAPLPAQEEAVDPVDQLAAMDVGSGGSGLVVGLIHENELDFLQAWGTVAKDSEEPLTAAHVLTYPDLLPALLAVTVRALDANGSLDADAPLASYLGQGVSPALADVTLDQLLTHRAGLDDADAGSDFAWESILTELPAGAKLLDPGTAFSWSRYSYPVAAAVLVRATGLPLEDLLARALFEPLGMTRTTFDARRAGEMGLVAGYTRNQETGQEERAPVPATVNGLPVLFTSAPDVIQFATAWASGGIAGADPVAGVEALDEGDEAYRDGVWVGRFRGAPRAFLGAESVGFGTELRIMPRSGSVLFTWKNGGRAGILTAWVQGQVATALGLPEEPGGPPPDPGAAEALADRPLPDPAEWAGTYRNGDRMVQLREGEGGELVVFVGQGDMALRWVGPGTLQALAADGRDTSLVFELREVEGTRLLIMARLAYLREGGADG